ncbi:NAD(P)-binding protein [Fodinicola feengrottensis]|uniref:NAD(P)-binding protein n=1 Tax=Fodinicola feengrottensis TaxID=435914 RepID=UPI0024424B09|nr:NAD(P)-binding protein [Fodinicola feengrottensis]
MADARGWVDAVVVGSGFGGAAAAACRLAEAGRSVCVLERGKTYPPGSFPRRPDQWPPTSGIPARDCRASSTSGPSGTWSPWWPAGSAAAR